jgi:hypothetical protein
MVPGEHNRIAAYNINGNNYIQLCDMAQKIDKWGGAGADGFDVRFNSEDNSVNLFSNTQFTGLDIGAEPQPKQGRRLESDVEEYMLSPEYTDAVREEFYILLNEHRVANGLTELEINLELQKYADIRADELRIRFGHIRPDESAAGSGWYDSKNYMNSRYAENAHGVGRLNSDPKTEAENIFTAWENSEGHNRHMLYDFDSNITMALGIVPKLDDDGIVRSGAIFATGY